ncbi:unnamed protein product [Bursaphelenchus xylophilus]|uniref:(pine wood nematode) hypothetical protein n=1 Tax=Bursaphelenchus xylophilus TaxID=6326 RepID=A0A1I7SV29_BURXY|nr:unnamed protein product [Bursaphelenchus xylophilus]CAG9100811.1 unnamed protein product [Bursaphelenchus xylophilus]
MVKSMVETFQKMNITDEIERTEDQEPVYNLAVCVLNGCVGNLVIREQFEEAQDFRQSKNEILCFLLTRGSKLPLKTAEEKSTDYTDPHFSQYFSTFIGHLFMAGKTEKAKLWSKRKESLQRINETFKGALWKSVKMHQTLRNVKVNEGIGKIFFLKDCRFD